MKHITASKRRGRVYSLAEIVKSIARVERVATRRHRARAGMTARETTNATIQLGYAVSALHTYQRLLG